MEPLFDTIGKLDTDIFWQYKCFQVRSDNEGISHNVLNCICVNDNLAYLVNFESRVNLDE